jgi:uracil phosphoribosyltransferase
MLGTGGSASMAIKVLQERGVSVDNIIFLNVVGCEVGMIMI